MNQINTIFWFRQDLRLNDNPGLVKAMENGQALLIYILDDVNAKDHAMGQGSRFWLHHSLQQLNKSIGNRLSVYQGDAKKIIQILCKQYPIQHVYWNRCYEPWRIERDKAIKSHLEETGIKVVSENASLLWEPWDIKKDDGTPFKVFTPFYRKGCLNATPPRQPLTKPQLNVAHDPKALSIDELQLIASPELNEQLLSEWSIGEKAAHNRLADFLEIGIEHYKGGRDFPSKPYVSKLSPHIHFGELSPNQIWYAVKSFGEDKHTDHYLSELGWREFSYSLLYHHPNLATENLQKKFDHFPWKEDEQSLHAWQEGLTGVPMVDAGMRQLKQMGYMHNRVRMIVGSFLVKNLLLHWHHGERWFWHSLVDADMASNSASWQWVAGCGADAAPYFRIFNPVTQGQKFDPDGDYIKQYIPELSQLPTKYIYCPWEAPEEVLTQAGVILGEDYPKPIVDLKQSREVALNAFSSLKGRNE